MDPEYESFARRLAATRLPGTDDRDLLRRLYSAIKRSEATRDELPRAKKATERKVRDRILACRRARRSVEKARDDLEAAHRAYGAGTEFDAAKTAVDILARDLKDRFTWAICPQGFGGRARNPSLCCSRLGVGPAGWGPLKPSLWANFTRFSKPTSEPRPDETGGRGQPPTNSSGRSSASSA